MIAFGTVVGKRYKIIDHIGHGGMQDVYLAKDLILDLEIALKTPLTGQINQRFKKSAKISAMVNHHNVAKTLDYFYDSGSEYLIEEYIKGETLEDKLQRFCCIDPHLGAHVLHHLAKGLAASHRVGVVHRDLKPSNVMATEGLNLHQLKITDFGISTLTKEVFEDAARGGDITRSTSGTIKGALPFMAPEMMFKRPDENPGTTVDIWSVGAMMFRLLTGEYPFGVYLEAAVNVKNRERKPWPTFMTSNAQFAPLAFELQAIIDSCLEYDPAHRLTADELVEKCQNLCYLEVDRIQGVVTNLIQNGYSGFINGEGETFFFSMESAYGLIKPDPSNDKNVCFSYFPGNPRRRAHPVIIIKSHS